MHKTVLAVILALVFLFVPAQAGLFAAEQKTPAAAAGKTAVATVMPAPNFAMIAGTIEKVDSSDPANIKLQVKNEADGTLRTISVTPYTSVTKMTDASELKEGDAIRMMTRKADDKEVAMSIMFGKMRPIAVPATIPKGVKPPIAAPKK